MPRQALAACRHYCGDQTLQNPCASCIGLVNLEPLECATTVSQRKQPARGSKGGQDNKTTSARVPLAGEIVFSALRWVQGEHDTCRKIAGLHLISRRHGAMVAGRGELVNCLSQQIVHGRFVGGKLHLPAGQLTDVEQANVRGGAGSAE
jgi:hypothetical protein